MYAGRGRTTFLFKMDLCNNYFSFYICPPDYERNIFILRCFCSNEMTLVVLPLIHKNTRLGIQTYKQPLFCYNGTFSDDKDIMLPRATWVYKTGNWPVGSTFTKSHVKTPNLISGIRPRENLTLEIPDVYGGISSAILKNFREQQNYIRRLKNKKSYLLCSQHAVY